MHTLYVPSTSNNNNPKTRSANKASPVFRRPNLTSSTRTIQTCLGWLKISRATFSPEFSLGTSSFVEARTYINVESESHRWERVAQVRTKVPTHRCNNRRSNLVDSVIHDPNNAYCARDFDVSNRASVSTALRRYDGCADDYLRASYGD